MFFAIEIMLEKSQVGITILEYPALHRLKHRKLTQSHHSLHNRNPQ